MYSIELSGSVPVTKAANDHGEIRKAVECATGIICVFVGNLEIFFGSKGDLLFKMEMAEEHGLTLYESTQRDMRWAGV